MDPTVAIGLWASELEDSLPTRSVWHGPKYPNTTITSGVLAHRTEDE